MQVDHPAGKVLVDLAQLLDKEVGDGTTSVVILAAELLRRANELVGAYPLRHVRQCAVSMCSSVDGMW